MKNDIKKFIAAVLDQRYKQANDHLKASVNEKIKRKIINNNSNLF
jgi:DNA-binding ferritin-like protein (Dps family)